MTNKKIFTLPKLLKAYFSCRKRKRKTANALKFELNFEKNLVNLQKQQTLPLHKPPTNQELKQILAVLNSYYGHFAHANSYNLRKNIYQKHFKKLKKYIKPVNNFQLLKIKKGVKNEK